MKYYDPILIGWGIDYLYIWCLGKDVQNKYALIDYISCINPHDNTKNGVRELQILKGCNDRSKQWNMFKQKYKNGSIKPGKLLNIMNNLIGVGFGELIMGNIKKGIQKSIPVFIKIITMIFLFITYPATPFIFILTQQLKQMKTMLYIERRL